MAERKVFNKYIPPDFDPRLLPKGERPANNQLKLRSMLPMTICCKTCGEFMGRGTKFNSRQEIAKGMDWKGIKRWRFYVKCTSCSSEMTFMTDPENDHYVPEMNCTSMTEPWRKEIMVNEEYQQQKEAEEANNPMQALANRGEEQKKLLDLVDTIGIIHDMNRKKHYMDHDTVIESLQLRKRQGLEQDRISAKDMEKELNVFRQAKRRRLNGNGKTSVVTYVEFAKEKNEEQIGNTGQKTTDGSGEKDREQQQKTGHERRRKLPPVVRKELESLDDIDSKPKPVFSFRKKKDVTSGDKDQTIDSTKEQETVVVSSKVEKSGAKDEDGKVSKKAKKKKKKKKTVVTVDLS